MRRAENILQKGKSRFTGDLLIGIFGISTRQPIDRGSLQLVQLDCLRSHANDLKKHKPKKSKHYVYKIKIYSTGKKSELHVKFEGNKYATEDKE